MNRRRSSLFEDLLSLATALPWWISVLSAAACFVVFGWLAQGEAMPHADLEGLSAVVVERFVVTGARIVQCALPLVLILGAGFSIARRVKGASLLDTPAAGDEEDRSPGEASGRPSSKAAALTSREFEMLVGEVYERQGYRVEEIAAGQDGGVDLVLRRGDERYFVRCKHWPSRPVDVQAVRELEGVIAEGKAEGGAVVTYSGLTRDAADFAGRAAIDLVDGDELRRPGLAKCKGTRPA